MNNGQGIFEDGKYSVLSEITALLTLIDVKERDMVANHYIKLWQEMPQDSGRKYVEVLMQIESHSASRGMGVPTAIAVYIKDLMYSQLTLDIDEDLFLTLNTN